MGVDKLKSLVITGTFVLLWGSAAIFTKLGIDNASSMILLVFRFSIALIVILIFCRYKQQYLPEKGMILQTALVGIILIGGYSICYFLSMENGVTPGLIATIMGVQPILSLCITERKIYGYRLVGLIMALSGLIVLVWHSLITSQLPIMGIVLSLMALLFMTIGAISQQKIKQSPYRVLPIQYAVSLVLCLLFIPMQTVHFNFNLNFLISILFLGIFISVIAQILLYYLLSKGNVVNVTSLFYFVPIVTSLLDYCILGNKPSLFGIFGMAAIILGIILVFYKPKKGALSHVSS
ncbi:DMT family transporter [Providencia rettgeri]|uniref:DMT family transporter n=2 Tax=Morganellaceae TaxID=1903414 RepID=UPI0018E6E0FA|nr:MULTISPECIES: DMT family transporter [Providencia]EJD6398713.1 DMT family transporter [Providencia rettgeri]EJD6612458.1 DMT family transporter [Providencia rettgeri]ELL9148527.1 DMT family transporter [Providencia rettgeri]ELR5240009.1 DMT family transporter [Providencia rettgeri]ELR5251395.1 DMT family transporter [Providencia rettgeri]